MMQRAQGFTLLELIAVIVIVSVMSIFIMISYPSNASFSLFSLTNQLKRDIRYTQTLAMSLNANYTITTSVNNYIISPNPPAGAVSVTLPAGVTLSVNSITFDSMGNPSNAAVETITITATGGGSSSFTVAPETGFVHG